jgi:hypothetical protein
MNTPGHPFPRSAVYVGKAHERGRLSPPFNFGQTGTAQFDPSHMASLIFVPDGEPEAACYVKPENLLLP